jgi:hypothetical protein
MSPDKMPDQPTPNPVPPAGDNRTFAGQSPEPPLEGVLTAEDIREIEASGITLADVIRAIETQIASAAE